MILRIHIAFLATLLCSSFINAEPLFTYNAGSPNPITLERAELSRDLADLKTLTAKPGLLTNTIYTSPDHLETRLEIAEKRFKSGDPRIGYTVRRGGTLIGYISLGDGDGFLGIGRGRAHIVYMFAPTMHEHLITVFGFFVEWIPREIHQGGSKHFGWFPLCEVIASIPANDTALRDACHKASMTPVPVGSHPSLATRLDLWWDNKYRTVNQSLTTTPDGLTAGIGEDNNSREMLYFSKQIAERPHGLAKLWYSPWGKVVIPTVIAIAVLILAMKRD